MNGFAPLIKIGLRGTLKHPLQAFLMVFGIALGVSAVVAIDIAKMSVSRSFELSTESLVSRSTHQIVGSDFSVPQEIFTALRTRLGIYKSAPVITSEVMVAELGESPMRLLGIDPFSENSFRKFTIRDGSNGSGEDFSRLISSENGVFLSGDLAAEKGLKAGDFISLMFGGRQVKLKISGFLDASDTQVRSISRGVVLTDIAVAQEILDMENSISRVDLILDDIARDESPLEDRIREILPNGVVLVETRTRNQTIRDLSRSFETSLTAFSMLALFMGMFLIYNTVSFSITRKKRLHGILRALGVSRSAVFLTVTAEVMIFAAAGSTVGVILGVFMGKAAVQAVVTTVSEMYYVLTVTSTAISPAALAKGFSAGVFASLAAAFFPAFRASKILPVSLMQRSGSESTLKTILPLLTFAGCIITGVAVYLLKKYAIHPGFDFLGVFMIFFGASLLSPFVILVSVSALNRILNHHSGGMVKMALRNLVRSLSRTSVLIASLMVVMSVYIGISTMTFSFRNSISDWVDGHIGGDIHVSSLDERYRSLDPDFIKKVTRLPQVSDVSAYNIHKFFSSASGEVHIFSYLRDLSEKQWVWTAGDVIRMENLLSKGWIFVSEIFVRRNQIEIKTGAEVVLQTLKGPVSFKIAGVFRDFFMGGGRVVVNRGVMAEFFGRTDTTSLQIFLKDRTQDREVIDTIRRIAPAENNLRIVSGAFIKQSILEAFDKTFLITAALQVLTVIVALTGILNSVMALLLERIRELGVLRACGAERGQIFRLLLTECAISGGLSGLMAMPLGLGLSWILIHVVNQRAFGWTYEMLISGRIFIFSAVLACSAAVAAGVYPALQAGRVDIKSALQKE